MNGKQAKRLRKAALGLGVTLSEAGKKIEKDGYTVLTHEPSKVSASSIMSSTQLPMEALSAELPSYQVLVRKDSVKGIYKHLKNRS